MAELYVMHHATCARKALMALFEKGAPVGTRELDRLYLRTSEYRALNPDGVVPTLVFNDGSALVESSIIMRYLDEAYDGPSLQPADPLRRAKMDLWLKLADDKLTLADCAMMPIMLRLQEFGLSAAWTNRLPRTTGWWNRLSGRASATRLVALADKALLEEVIVSVEGAREAYLKALA